jgi:hypothetical protein
MPMSRFLLPPKTVWGTHALPRFCELLKLTGVNGSVAMYSFPFEDRIEHKIHARDLDSGWRSNLAVAPDHDCIGGAALGTLGVDHARDFCELTYRPQYAVINFPV